MNMIHYALLPDRGVLTVSGEDARPFLQGLISNDIHKVTQERAVFAALLSPQGRFLHDFFIIEHEGRLLLETEKDRMSDLIKRLSMYKLRSKVEFTPLPEWSVTAVWGEESCRLQVAGCEVNYSDPRLPELGRRIIHKAPSAFAAMTQGDYDYHRISLGVPSGSKDLMIDRSILLEYGYDELHGVDFAKGCYVGQEVTARSKHRATLRKFICCVKGDAPLPPADTPVMAGEREAGSMRSSTGDIGLALLNVEEAQKPLTCAGNPLAAHLPPWRATPLGRDAK